MLKQVLRLWLWPQSGSDRSAAARARPARRPTGASRSASSCRSRPAAATDAVARAMRRRWRKILGQPVVVENRAGAGGMLGVDAIAKAAPDGYTIGIAGAARSASISASGSSVPYDPVKDLALISRAAESPFILMAPQALTANSLRDVIKLAKAEPGKLSIGHGGNGTAMQLAALTFVTMADVKIEPGALSRHGAGRSPTRSPATSSSASPIRRRRWARSSEGKLKALAVSSKQRFRVFPDVPTADEHGSEGLRDHRLVRHRRAGGDAAGDH